MTMPLRDRWWVTWQALGVEDAAMEGLERTYGDLMARYGEPHRHYHTGQHLVECFERWDLARSRGADPGALELALWYHDAIYEPRRRDNERRSAALAGAIAIAAQVAPARVAWVERAIEATAHHGPPPEDDDMRLLLDLDLGILAAPRDRFESYCQQIRQEYHWVPEAQFRAARRHILQHFLDRPFIFATPEYRDRGEEAARHNLRWAITILAD